MLTEDQTPNLILRRDLLCHLSLQPKDRRDYTKIFLQRYPPLIHGKRHEIEVFSNR